ncbi:hypothetical protein CKK33_06835 [Mucilaginibacter sp. MD40]|nr:hypothetical protein CKK33_06835 [Mucilaginibacter sp. MD40]
MLRGWLRDSGFVIFCLINPLPKQIPAGIVNLNAQTIYRQRLYTNNMEEQYYISYNEQEQGPYSLQQIMQMNPDVDTMILAPNAADWQRASDLPELFQYFESRGFYFPTEDNLASFWIRLLAYLIDAIIISLMISALLPGLIMQTLEATKSDAITTEALLIRLKFNVVVFIFSTVYNTLWEASSMRGSLGKILCRLAVSDEDGRKLTIGRALLRNLGKFVSGLVLWVGYLAVLWDSRNQAWHDKWAKTYVLVKNR